MGFQTISSTRWAIHSNSGQPHVSATHLNSSMNAMGPLWDSISTRLRWGPRGVAVTGSTCLCQSSNWRCITCHEDLCVVGVMEAGRQCFLMEEDFFKISRFGTSVTGSVTQELEAGNKTCKFYLYIF